MWLYNYIAALISLGPMGASQQSLNDHHEASQHLSHPQMGQQSLGMILLDHLEMWSLSMSPDPLYPDIHLRCRLQPSGNIKRKSIPWVFPHKKKAKHCHSGQSSLNMGCEASRKYLRDCLQASLLLRALSPSLDPGESVWDSAPSCLPALVSPRFFIQGDNQARRAWSEIWPATPRACLSWCPSPLGARLNAL